MKSFQKSTAILLVFALLLVFSDKIKAEDPLGFVVLRENSIGSGNRAQPYLDHLLGKVAEQNKWPLLNGRYLTRRDSAITYIDTKRPRFGILSLAAFLALKKRYKLRVIGQVTLSVSSDRQFFIVSKKLRRLDDCKNQVLASNHLQDLKFIHSVVAQRAFRISEFKTIETRRPVQTLKKVIRNQAQCALIDQAQMNELERLEGGKELKVVWKSQLLPPMPVVAFPSASAKQVKGLQTSLKDLCNGQNETMCKNMGITSLKTASNSDYSKVIAAYAR